MLMFLFDNEQLKYLLNKLKVQLDNKVNKEQYISSIEKNTNGSLTIVADETDPLDVATQITLSEANKLNASDNVVLNINDKVEPTYSDKVLSDAIFTEEEKEALKYILEKGSIEEILNDKLYDYNIVVLDQEEYEAADKDYFSNLYIIVDSDEDGNEKLPVQLELDKLLRIDDFNTLVESKVDKEILSVEIAADGTHEIVADDEEPFDFSTMIKVSDPALNGLTVNVGDKVNVLEEKVLTDFNYTEKDNDIVELMKDLGAENLLTESDIVSSFPIDIDNVDDNGDPLPEEQRKVLAATLGEELEVNYLSGKKYRYISQAEYDALFDEDGNFIGESDPDNKDVVYRIIDSEELFGLSEEQMLVLKSAYEHSLIDESSIYASSQEIYDARRSVNGIFYNSLSERLLNIDNMIKEIMYGVDGTSTFDFDRNYKIYGMSYNFEEEITKRLYDSISLNSSNFNIIQPWSGIRRCNIKDGQVVCYENEEGYAEDGTNGDVMVEIPKFYYRVDPVELKDIINGKQVIEAKWLISQTPILDFKIHPAFIRNGIEMDHIYVGAFENSLNDNKLMSIANTAPHVATMLSEIQDLCAAKGNGFESMDILTLSALQLLFVIEHGSFNSQSCVGLGLVNENSISNSNADDAISYRGIENLWGNVWNTINGLNLQLSFNVADSGFIDGFGYDGNNDFLFIPISANGSSVISPCDMCEQDGVANQLVSIAAGNTFNSGINAGLFSYKLNGDINMKANDIGSRLQFYK